MTWIGEVQIASTQKKNDREDQSYREILRLFQLPPPDLPKAQCDAPSWRHLHIILINFPFLLKLMLPSCCQLQPITHLLADKSSNETRDISTRTFWRNPSLSLPTRTEQDLYLTEMQATNPERQHPRPPSGSFLQPAPHCTVTCDNQL